MTYRIKAHPTKYAGVMFRSRLEATWAAFFDLTGWQWKYEPVDLQGWSPDFEISHPDHLPVATFVEVKPTWGMIEGIVKKVAASGVERAIFLANGPGAPEWAEEHFITFDDKFGPPLGLIAFLAGDEPEFGDHLVGFNPRMVTDRYWAEATNITRWVAA